MTNSFTLALIELGVHSVWENLRRGLLFETGWTLVDFQLLLRNYGKFIYYGNLEGYHGYDELLKKEGNVEDMKGCPFCGDKPELLAGGTEYEIHCCTSMTLQVCDYMTIEERQSCVFDIDKYNGYEPKYRDMAKEKLIKQWNTRA